MNQLHQQIDRYFEAELTLQEEMMLFETLLKMEGKDPIADEALAVMLASRMMPKASKSRKKISVGRMVGIAASIAAIITIGSFFFPRHQIPQTFAYVAGRKIQDNKEISKIVVTQLKEIGESTDMFSQTISTDLEDIREALTIDDI